MQTLTRKSRTALLVFLSVISLALVLSVSTPGLLAKHHQPSSQSQILTNLSEPRLTKAPEKIMARGSMRVTAQSRIDHAELITIQPWTETIHARAPPRS